MLFYLCLGKIHDVVNAYNVKLAAALATDVTIISPQKRRKKPFKNKQMNWQ